MTTSRDIMITEALVIVMLQIIDVNKVSTLIAEAKFIYDELEGIRTKNADGNGYFLTRKKHFEIVKTDCINNSGDLPLVNTRLLDAFRDSQSKTATAVTLPLEWSTNSTISGWPQDTDSGSTSWQ